MSVTVVSVAGMVFLTALFLYIAVVQRRRRRLPRLRGDWWPEFERDFRAHVARVTRNREQAP